MSEPAPSLRHAFPWLIATLVAVHACMALTRVTASLWVLNQGHGEWTVGVLLSLFAVAPLFLSLWAGRLADRRGFHAPVGVGVAMAFGGAALALAWPTLPSIALSCLASGGAVSIAAVAIQREAGLMADGSGDLKRIFSWVALGPALSNALSPVVAGLLIDAVGYRAGFALALLLPLLAWGLSTRVPRHPPPTLAAQASQGAVWDLLRDPALRRLLLLNVVLSTSWDAHSFVVPVMGHVRGLSASSIGLVLGAFAVAATLVRLAIVRYAARLDELKALRAAMALAAATLAVYAWLPGTPGLMLGSAILGLALGSVQPMVMSTLHQITPRQRHGEALALRSMAINGSSVLMPLLFGSAGTLVGIGGVFWMVGAVVGSGSRLAWGLRHHAALEPPGPQRIHK